MAADRQSEGNAEIKKNKVLTPELNNLLTQEIALYRGKNPNERASDRFLRELSLKWLLVSGKLTIKNRSGVEVVSGSSALRGFPENLCDDTLDFSSLNLQGFLDEILEFAVDAMRQHPSFEGASDDLQLAMVLAFKLEQGEVERFSVGETSWFRTTEKYEETVSAFAATIYRG